MMPHVPQKMPISEGEVEGALALLGLRAEQGAVWKEQRGQIEKHCSVSIPPPPRPWSGSRRFGVFATARILD